MAAVVIAAHNEAEVIGRCLRGVLGAGQPASRVVVAANGCTDATVQVARQWPVQVLDLPVAGKTAALNAADRVATGFPRVYLDADIELRGDELALLVAAVARPGGPLAATGRRVIHADRCGWIVRMYYRSSVRHPAFADGLFGRGVIVLSQEGRSRFESFPELVADDLFLDSLFARHEKCEVPEVAIDVTAPVRGRDLVRRLARVRRGNAELRARADAGVQVRRRSGLGWLGQAVRREPSLAVSAAVYLAVTLTASSLARWGDPTWGQDRSSRTDSSASPESPVPVSGLVDGGAAGDLH